PYPGVSVCTQNSERACFLLESYGHHRAPHSFPTRRSSDLAMVNAAKKAGNIVQIGFQRRQNEAFKKAKQIIEEGQIGKIYQIGADRKSTRLNSSHVKISYAVFCLKKKNKQ